MNYQKIYNSIIENRKQNDFNGYTETHHIIPKSLGGSADASNLIKLSAKEHFICHLLLTKIYKHDTVYGKKMIKAFMLMLWFKTDTQERYITSKEYAILREKFSTIQRESQTGEGNSQYGTRWITDGTVNKKLKKNDNVPTGWKLGRVTFFTEEQKIQISKRSSYNQSGEKNSNYGKIKINNGIINKTIPKNDAIPDGWIKGQIRKVNIIPS